MPNLIQRQRRLTEVGRIRVGDRKVSEKQPGRPRATFRFTSAYNDIIQTVATAYGGNVVKIGNEYEVCIEASEIKVLFSAKQLSNGDYESLSQWWEQWAGNTCTHRCDGQLCQVWRDKLRASVDCSCDHSDGGRPACQLKSRMSVMLPEAPSLGMWRLDTTSQVFAGEIQGLLDTLSMLQSGLVYPLTMAIETRQKRTAPGEKTSVFPVVKLLLDPSPVSMAAMVQRIQMQSFAPLAGHDALSAPSMGELPAPPPTDGDGVIVDELEKYAIEILGETFNDYLSWCEGEDLDWRDIASKARAKKVADLTTFWEGAEKLRDHKASK